MARLQSKIVMASLLSSDATSQRSFFENVLDASSTAPAPARPAWSRYNCNPGLSAV